MRRRWTLADTFKHSAVRKLAFVLVAAFLAWLGIGRADAQDYSSCYNVALSGTVCPHKGDAYIYAEAAANDMNSRLYPTAGYQVEFHSEGAQSGTHLIVYYGIKNPGGGYVQTAYRTWPKDAGCPAGTIWNESQKACVTDCSAAAPQVIASTPPNGTIMCDAANQCESVAYYNGDGTSSLLPTGNQCPEDPEAVCNQTAGYYWSRTTFQCRPIEPEECPEGTAPKEGVCQKPNECPAGMVPDQNGLCKPKNEECPAGMVKGPDGSCVGDDNNCAVGTVKGADGTCKTDADGDGEPDAEEDNDGDGKPDGQEDNDGDGLPDGTKSFSGGDSCTAPPVCAGDPIMCGQARIQWRIDCNTRINTTVSGGSCDAPPSCTGEKCNALEAASLIQQWRTACAVQALLAQGNGDGEGEGDQPEWTKVDGMNQDPGLGSSPGDTDVWAEDKTIDGSTLDYSGFVGGGGSCPAITPASSSGWGGQFLSEMPTGWCDYISAIYAILVALATFTGIGILGRP